MLLAYPALPLTDAFVFLLVKRQTCLYPDYSVFLLNQLVAQTCSFFLPVIVGDFPFWQMTLPCRRVASLQQLLYLLKRPVDLYEPVLFDVLVEQRCQQPPRLWLARLKANYSHFVPPLSVHAHYLSVGYRHHHV